MSGKANKITDFFTKVTPVKPKSASAAAGGEDLAAGQKENVSDNVAKTPDKQGTKRLSEDGQLTPDHQQRMMQNKQRALLLRTSRELPVVTTNMGASWFAALNGQFKMEYFSKLNSFVQAERARGVVYPPPEEVWSWTTRTDIKDVRVVILGQDPYHGPGQAHGLCFSVRPPVPPPPSLVNMFTELEADIEGFKRPGHGCLVGWADQGVLLLNACLTVRKAEANSHKDRGWEKLTDAVIKWISDNCSGVVFLLWGSYAQKKAAHVNSKKHHLLKSVHPSPLSAYRGFYGCKHFSKCNELLVKSGKKPIDWAYLPKEL